MAGPITWRSLQPSADPNLGAQLLANAQRSINNAFDPFQKIIQDQHAFGAQQAGLVREGNREAFLEALHGTRTPEELASLQASGRLDALRANLTPDNLAVVRKAEAARLTDLRQQIVAGQQFELGQIDYAQMPIKDQYGALLAQGKLAEAQALLASNPQLRGQALLQDAAAKTERALVDRSRSDLDYAQRVTERERGNRIGTIQLTNAEQAAADAAETRRLEERLAREAAKVGADRDASGQALGALAKEMGLPLTAQGRPDFAKFDSQQLSSFDDVAGIKGLPTSTTYSTGDTVKADSLFRSLAGSGEFSPRVLRANEGAVRGVFSSSLGTPVGNDAVNLALANAQNQVGFDRVDANNAFHAPGSADARNAFDSLAKEIPEIIKGMPSDWTRGFNAGEDVPDLQKSLLRMATEGVKVTIDGKEETVVPSANIVKGILRTVEGGWFSDSKRAQNLEAAVQQWMRSSAGQTMIREGLLSQKFRDQKRVEQVFRENLLGPKK